MAKQIQNDLGNDGIGKLLLRLAIPAITAQLINALYNIVDRIYISRIPITGSDALTGVGVTFPVLMIITAFSMLIGMGGAPRAAMKMGEKKNDEAEKILGNCFISLLIISVVLTVFFLLTGRQLLMMFGASENTVQYGLDYMNIYVVGTIFVQLALGLNSFISTQGFAKTAMTTVLIGAILNTILDPLFIFVFGMGVKGAAIATVLSQAVSAIWVVKFLFSKNSILKIKVKYFKLKPTIIFPVLALGLSPFIMQSTESLVNIALNSSLQRYGGDTAVGAMTIIGSIMQFCLMPLTGIASSAQPIVSFNFGAGKIDRVKKTFKCLFIASISFSVIMWILIMGIPQVFVQMFSNDETLLGFTVWAIRIFTAGVFMLGAQFACQQTFVALGQAKISLVLALLRKVFLLIPLIFIIPMFFSDPSNKVFGIFLAEPIADITAAIVTSTVFFFKFRSILEKRKLQLNG